MDYTPVTEPWLVIIVFGICITGGVLMFNAMKFKEDKPNSARSSKGDTKAQSFIVYADMSFTCGIGYFDNDSQDVAKVTIEILRQCYAEVDHELVTYRRNGYLDGFQDPAWVIKQLCLTERFAKHPDCYQNPFFLRSLISALLAMKELRDITASVERKRLSGKATGNVTPLSFADRYR